MTIAVSDLKFFQSERMTDNADGGGQMSGTEIVSGQENQIFDDVSDVDRAAGDVSIRKVYAAVTSTDTDKYLDAGVVVFRAPADPAASVLAFSTGSYYDERDAIKSRLEQTIVRGARWNGWLWGQHLAGQRAIVLWQRPEVELPATGHRLELVARAASAEQYSQFLWITRITDTLRNRIDGDQNYTIREVVCELAEALTANYAGIEPTRSDPIVGTSTTLLYDTRYNAEAVALFGIRPTQTAAGVGDYSVRVDTLYESIIPTALMETALADINPGGDSPTLIAGNDGTISFTTTTQTIKPSVALYLGTGAKPGTISIAVSGATLTDDNGTMRLAGTDVGSVDYGNGILSWNSSCPNYAAASKVVTFSPVTRALRVADTAAMAVTAENRGYVWTMTLSPIPAPQTLRVSYRVNNKWYVLNDLGGGQLAGTDSSYGNGSLNFSTGTVLLTIGALPDVNSELIYTWGTPVSYTARGGDPVDAPVVRGQTANANVMPGSVSVSWTVGETTYTLDDETTYYVGQLAGTGGTGGIDYGSGEWWVRPATLPPVNTEFTIDYYWGAPLSKTFTDPAEDLNGKLLLELNEINIVPLSVHFALPLHYPGTETQSARNITVYAQDQGDGHFWPFGPDDALINYTTGTIQVKAERNTVTSKKLYEKRLVGTDSAGRPVWREVHTGWDQSVSVMAHFPAGGSITVYYRTDSDNTSASETVTLTQLELDLTRGYGETISAGSVRFTLGNSVYVDTAGQLYRDPSPETGAGTLCGTVDRSSGRVRINSWLQGGTNAVVLQSCVTELAGQPIEEVVFRTPVSPIRSGTLQLRYQLLDGTVKTKTVDGTGMLEDADCTLRVDYPLGIVRARFGLWKADASLTPEEKLEPWYDPDALVDIGGVLKIWKPAMVLADSVLYNAVAQTVLPPDSALLGINAARLPPDGKGLIFNTGRLCLVHHTATHAENSLSPTQQIDMGRVRLYRVVIDDDDGKRLPASFYSVNRETGIVTMAADLNLTGYTGPYVFSHTVADLARIVGVDIDGTLQLNKALSHEFPEGDSRVSGMLYVGTMQARYTSLFSQATWTDVWQDTRIGSAPLAQYNDVTYPIVVSNLGAYHDRYLFKFTSSTAFQCIGENLGFIAAGNINETFTPINPLTNAPYLSIDYRGWGSNWATGNCLRFNIVGANYPVDLIRAIQPSAQSGLDTDAVELLFIGNVDA